MQSNDRSTKPKVDIVVLVYNSGDMLRQTLPTVCATDYPNFEVIVIDNGSTDGSTDFISSNQMQKLVRLVKLDKNYGCGGGLNRSVPFLTGEYVAFLNEDIIPDRNWLQKSVEMMEKDETTVAVMSKLISPKTNRVEAVGTTFDMITCTGNPSTVPMVDIPYAGLGATLFRTSQIRQMPIEERYFLYCEDVDYSLRIRAEGGGIKMCQDSVLYHYHQGSVKRNFSNEDVSRMAVRNKLLIFFGFYPAHLLVILFPIVLGKIFLGGIKHAILTNPKHFIATVCGIAEAFDLDWIRRKRRETKGMMEQLLKTKQGSMSKQHRME